MQKILVRTLRSVLFLIIAVSLFKVAHASRLPNVGDDNDQWGQVLNDYLNVSLNESGSLRVDVVTSSQIKDGSITDADISDTTNITTTGYGFFSWLGSLTDRILKLFVQDIQASGDVNATTFTLNGETINDWSEVGNNGTFEPIVGFTSSAYDGDITNGTLVGYAAANQICNLEYPGSHFCLKSEVLKTIANGNYSFTGTAWFQNGPPGYTANSDDCAGWTTDSNTFLGPFWNWDHNSQAGKAALTNCAQSKKLMCCGGNS